MTLSLPLGPQLVTLLLRGILFILRKSIINLLAKIGKNLLNILPSLGRGLQVVNPQTLSQLLGLAFLNCPAILKIGLVTHQYLNNSFPSILLDLLKPVLNVIEGGSVSNVEHNNYSIGSLVVGLSDGLETILPSGVPNVKFDLFVIDIDIFDFEVHSDGWKESVMKNVVRKPEQNVGLAD